MALARAEIRAEQEGLSVRWENEWEAWEGGCPEPNIHVCAYVPDPLNPKNSLAALGGIGLNSWHDPYVRVVRAELLLEALDELDARRDIEATRMAAELSERATYAAI